MYGRDGRPSKESRTVYGHVPKPDIARVCMSLRAAREAKDPEALARALLDSHHIPMEVFGRMPHQERSALEVKTQENARRYIDAPDSQ
jgi:hypothetical protein